MGFPIYPLKNYWCQQESSSFATLVTSYLPKKVCDIIILLWPHQRNFTVHILRSLSFYWGKSRKFGVGKSVLSILSFYSSDGCSSQEYMSQFVASNHVFFVSHVKFAPVNKNNFFLHFWFRKYIKKVDFSSVSSNLELKHQYI